MTDALILRPYEPADLPVLQAIRAAAFVPVFASFRAIVGPRIAELGLANAEAEQAKLLDELCAPDPDKRVQVAVAGGDIVGFVCFSLNRESRTGEVVLDAVRPDCAGRGVGTRLVAFALQVMRDEGMQLATVGVGGDAAHAPARRAYAKAGFGPAIPSQWMYCEL